MAVEKQNRLSSVFLGKAISLKWKAIGLTSVVLLVIVAGFTVSAHKGLLRQFEQQQQLLLETRKEALAGLIKNAWTALHGMASVAKSLEGVETALLSQDSSQLVQNFGRHYSELSMQLGLDEARFFSRSNRLLAAFGRSDVALATQRLAPRWVAEVNANEQPITVVYCTRVCRLYIVSPLLVSGKRLGTVLFAMPLAQIVSSFYWVAKTDIALLMPDDDFPENGGVRRLAEWNVRLQALTNSSRHRPLLIQTAKHHDLADLETGVIERVGEVHYRLDAIPLKLFTEGARGHWVLISDVTDSLTAIQASIRTNSLYGILGLAVAEFLLGLFLWKPLSRLRKTAETLPLLGQGAFQRAREAIAARRSKETTLFTDESDILDETAIALSERLELLEFRVASRTKELRSQAYEIRRERDFVQRLLDTAEAIILTQDRDQNILSLNAFGEKILNSPETSQPTNLNFTGLLASENDAQEISWLLKSLVDGQRDNYQHNASIRRPNAEEKAIAWRHSRLEKDSGEFAVLSIGLDVSEQRKAERRIAWLADHDPLTELFNRRRLQEELRRAIAEATRFDYSGGLLYIDLDQFKYINDASGHAVGDSLLKTVAATLKRNIRSTDIVSRLGGDEFAILLPQTDEEGAIALAKKIRSALTLLQVGAGGRTQRVSASIGIALYPEHGVDVQDLLATADVAMYQAKSRGRDRWQLYSPKSLGREFIRSELEMKTIVENALAENRLEFHYQPILDLHAGSISHVEALLRIKLADGQLVMPGEFIGVAERTGIISEIDKFVLRLAAREIQAFVKAGLDVRVSVNQSAFAFDDPTFLTTMKHLLAEHPFLSGHLMLEITESAAVTNFISTCEVLHELRNMGCLVAIDDFGTGFSSLKYLNQLPVDYIKIDGVFVKDIVDKQDDQILVRAVIEVAHMFGKKTIAEYVEREEVYRWLCANDADYAQGYNIGRAMPRSEIYKLLKDWKISTSGD